jgi:[ribosomal protein S5]-alanine N-acetyltransferase
MSSFPILETEKLLLREITQEDSSAILELHQPPSSMKWLGIDPITQLSEAENLIEKYASWRQLPNPGIRWGITKKNNHKIIGSCGLFKWNKGWKSCSIGYELTASERGEGLMKEALSAALEWGFSCMNLNRIEAQIHPENSASIKLASSLGFIQEGIMREGGYWDERFHDLLQFSLLRKDWNLTLQSTGTAKS